MTPRLTPSGKENYSPEKGHCTHPDRKLGTINKHIGPNLIGIPVTALVQKILCPDCTTDFIIVQADPRYDK